MTELEKLRAERDMLMQALLAMGSIDEMSQCQEHDNCFVLHVSSPNYRLYGGQAGGYIKSDPEYDERLGPILQPLADTELSPELVDSLSSELGVPVEIIRDADSGNWVCETDGLSVTAKTLTQAINEFKHEFHQK